MPNPQKRVDARLMLIVALGLAVRLAYLFLQGSPNSLMMPDAADYRQAGVDLFQHGRIASDIVMPLYPVWTYVTGGHLGLQVADVLVSAATVAAVYYLTVRIFEDRRAALLAALVTALYPFLIYYAPAGVTETLFIFLVCCAFLSLYSRRFVFGGVVLVLAILTRPAIAPLAPFLVFAFSALVHKESVAQSVRRALFYVGIFALMMSPWWVHNYNKYETFVATDLGAGNPMFYGNVCPRMDLGVQAAATGPRQCDIDFDRISSPIARSDSLKSATLRFARENKSYIARLVAAKFVAFWRPWVYTPGWPAQVASLAMYGVALVISIIFLMSHWKACSARLSPFLFMAAYLSVVHALSYSYIRYRLPLEPFMIAIASFALVSAFRLKIGSSRD